MKIKIHKLAIVSLLVVTVCSVVLLPKTLSLLYPKKAPIGYHFMYPTYFAIWVGLEKLITISPQIPKNITVLKNIEYTKSGNMSHTLDLYIPDNKHEPAPLLVFVHGGGWGSGKKEDYATYLLAFAEKGYVTATVSYRLSGEAVYPAAKEDVASAIDWLYLHGKEYGYDKNRIAIIGGSAGAHLALLTAYNEEQSNRKIKAVVDLYGPADLTTEYARTQPDVTSFMGSSYENLGEVYKEASPIFHITKNSPATLIFHGTSDALVPVTQSDELQKRLDLYNVPNVYYALPLWPHTMDIILRVNMFTQEKMEEFFLEHLK